MKKNKINYKLLGATIFLFIALLFSLTTKWALKNFDFTVEELIFHLKVPMKGVNLVVLFDFLRKCLLKTFIYVFILTFILRNPFEWKLNAKIKNKIINVYPLNYNETIYVIFTLILMIFSVFSAFNKIGITAYFNDQISKSTFI